MMSASDAAAAQHSTHTTAALKTTRNRLSAQLIQSADALREAVDATIPGRITTTDRAIRQSLLPERSREEAQILEGSYENPLAAVRRGLRTQEELAVGSKNRTLYRQHVATSSSGNALGAAMSHQRPQDGSNSHSDDTLRRSVSASSYNRREVINASNSSQSYKDHEKSSYNSDVSCSGSTSSMGALNSQIQSLSSRIRDRLQRPPV